MTRRLSGIHAAWHFWFSVSFGGESGLRKRNRRVISPRVQNTTWRAKWTECERVGGIYVLWS
ncbi:DUF3265 domain-containing protein [Vibrio vulnificus]|nr:DUF3265 domain-containing protein [Vibrio vulnificus]MCU8470209.1 DUF3265 domain-containing protein [Vibrio vulnificus]